MNPIPKAVASSEIPPPSLNDRLSEADIWEPPFERWLRLADWLLANNATPGESTFPRKTELFGRRYDGRYPDRRRFPRKF